MKHEFIKDIHYYMDGDRVVFTEKWHVLRGQCCGSKCRHCPFTQPCKKGNEKIREEFAYLKKDS